MSKKSDYEIEREALEKRNEKALKAMTPEQIETSFDNLVKAFGKPHDDGDGYKTNAEWQFITDDGVVFTLYNWKNGITYGGLPVEDITVWNIGGFDIRAVEAVKERLSQ